MDQLDQQINKYIDSKVTEILASALYVNLPEEQKSALAPKLRSHLNSVITDTMVDRMTHEQLEAVKNLPPDSQEMADKIEEFAATMPFLAQDIEEKLSQAVSDIKQKPQVIGG